MIPFGIFWVLLALGWYWKELSAKTLLTFAFIYTTGSFVLTETQAHRAVQIIFIVILNIALVYKIFGGDVRLR